MENKIIVTALNVIAFLVFLIFLVGAIWGGVFLIEISLVGLGFCVLGGGVFLGILSFVFIMGFASILEELIDIRIQLKKMQDK